MRKLNISAVVVMSLASAWLIDFMPRTVCAQINGTTSGATATGNGPAFKDTSTTINMGYYTSCPYIDNGITAGGFGAYNFVYAGQGPAAAIPNIPSSDFTIDQYKPWVVNNNTTTNFVTAPAGPVVQRGITNDDAGGADILIYYTPRKGSTDPTTVNFVQAYIESKNGGAFTTGTIDNGTSTTPFYNDTGVHGVGTTRGGAPPMMTSPTKPGWIIDVPYTSAPDTSETDYFQTFISSQVNIGGTNYNVLYGGVQWGYSFSEAALPEPASVALFVGVFGAAALRRQRLRVA